MRATGKLSAAGLVLLGLITVLLSATALLQHRGGAAEPGTSPTAPATSPATPDDDADTPGTEATSTPVETPEAESTPPSAASATVVILGDSNSVGDPEDTWVGAVTEALGWGDVVNLSAPGRGYVQPPRSCDLEVCANFRGTIPLVADQAPDIVVTFGGTADGDYSLADPAAEYFEALREALPDAQLVAITPVTGESDAPYWLTLHKRTITAGVEAVGGVVIDVGQPGLGDGTSLSDEAQAEIARIVIEHLAEP